MKKFVFRGMPSCLRRMALSTLILGACCCSTASAASIPDPTLPGPDTVTKVEYYGGSVMMSAPNANGSATAAFQHPLDGALFYPNGPGPFDVVILIHGNHADCLTATGSETTPSQSQLRYSRARKRPAPQLRRL